MTVGLLLGDSCDYGFVVRVGISHGFGETEAGAASILAILFVANLVNNEQSINLTEV